jgi:hypothetical protein
MLPGMPFELGFQMQAKYRTLHMLAAVDTPRARAAAVAEAMQLFERAGDNRYLRHQAAEVVFKVGGKEARAVVGAIVDYAATLDPPDVGLCQDLLEFEAGRETAERLLERVAVNLDQYPGDSFRARRLLILEGRNAEKHLRALIGELTSPAAPVRCRAAEELSHLGARAESALDALQGLYYDPYAKAGREAAFAVLAISSDPAHRKQALDVLLSQTDERARARTAERLLEILTDPHERGSVETR